MRAGVFRIRRHFRFQVHCYCPRAGYVQNRLAGRMGELGAAVKAEIVADADPTNLI